jgi:hypothetical protein
LPVQFFTRTAWSDTPEKRLIFAVLMDAIVELKRGEGQAAIDAERWIRDETDDAPIRFSEACEFLGLEAPGLARGLLRWSVQSERFDVPDPCASRRYRVTATGRLRIRAPVSLRATVRASGA